MLTINAECNGHSFLIHGNEILCLELNRLARIYFSVISADMVDFCRPGHKLVHEDQLLNWTIKKQLAISQKKLKET